MDIKAYQELLEELNIICSSNIIKQLKKIKYIANILEAGLFLLYFLCHCESYIGTYFKELFGDTFGVLVAIFFLSLLVCILFVLHEVLFLFLPKVLFLKREINQKHQSRDGSVIDSDKH